MQKWEYRIIITSIASHDRPQAEPSGMKILEADLNEAGQQGWELFQVLSIPRDGAVSVCHYLKRPRGEIQEIQQTLAEMTE